MRDPAMILTREMMQWFKADEFEPPIGEKCIVCWEIAFRRDWMTAVYHGQEKYHSFAVPMKEIHGVKWFMVPADPGKEVQILDETI